jgi:enolase-phosphatase E1
MTVSLSALNVRGILLDIEGTTTPIAFVHAVLFPLARRRVKDYLAAHRTSDAVLRDLHLLRAEHATELDPPAITQSSDSMVDYIYWLDRDHASTGLKSLQERSGNSYLTVRYGPKYFPMCLRR